MMEIHAVLFDKKHWTTDKARRELEKMNLKAYKRVHITDNYLRYSMTKAKKGGNYITKEISPAKHITAVFEIKK